MTKHARFYQRCPTRPLFIFGLFALALVAGCAGLERSMRSALDVSATAVNTTDVHVAVIYRDKAIEFRLASATIDEYRERMGPLDAVELALRVAHDALLAAESGLDASGAESILSTIGCVALSFERLMDALTDAGVDIPPLIARALEAISALPGATCNGGAS